MKKDTGTDGRENSLNILQVVACFPPAYAYGGPVKSVYELSKVLVKNGHEVTVFTTDALDSESRVDANQKHESLDGIDVRRFRNLSHSLAWDRNISNAPGMVFALRDEIEEFDVVHIHEYRFPEAIFAGNFARKNDVPYILQPRGSMPRSNKSKQKKLFDVLFGHRLVHGAERIIASSKIESEQYRDVFSTFPEEKVVHYPNGIDMSEYNEMPNKGRFRDKYEIDDGNIILFLSRIHERKGADILIKAFAQIQDTTATLVIAGPNEGHLSELKNLVKSMNLKDDVVFTGPLYDVDKLEAYVDADVFVLPSKNKYESFGNVILEAMACNTSVVMTNVCGVSEWVKHDMCHIVNPTPSSISTGISEVLEKSKTSAEPVREYVKDGFSWRNIADDMETLYKGMVQ